MGRETDVPSWKSSVMWSSWVAIDSSFVQEVASLHFHIPRDGK